MIGTADCTAETKRLGVIPVAVLVAAAPAIAKLAAKLGPIIKGFGKLVSKIGLGGSNQTRFINRYYEMKDFLTANGYSGVPLSTWLDKYDVRKTDVDNHKPQSYWRAAFGRLRLLFIDWLNYVNPGLGTDYGKVFPEWKMVNEGQIYDEPVEALKLIVQTFPRGMYIPGTLQEVIALENTKTEQTVTSSTQQIANGYKVVKDASGKVKQVYDAAGKLINPGTPEYSAALDANNLKPQEAGFGNWGMVIGGGLILGTLVAMVNDKKKGAKPAMNGPVKAAKKRSKKK